MGNLRLLLLSDPHFFVKDDESGHHHSHLPLTKEGRWHRVANGSKKNPLTDLLELLRSENITSDLVLCAGDITTRANPVALKFGWKSLIEIGQCVNAEIVASATGNHDIRSRSEATEISRNVIHGLSASKSPIEELKQLDPTYPIVWMQNSEPRGRRDIQGKYFGEYFVLLDDHANYRLLIVNSCCEHGHDSHEFERGTLPQSALRWIKEDVANLSGDKVNILLLHHPPQSESSDGQAYDFCRGADLLLAELQAGLAGSWVVFHGHKHDPKLKNGPSATGVAPVILSAASFAAADELPAGSKNQVYLITIDSVSGHLRGGIEAWHWSMGNSWQRTSPTDCSGIYDGCGFGARLSPIEIASKISAAYDSGQREWKDLMTLLPELSHVMPSAMNQAVRIMRDRHRLVIDKDNRGCYQMIVRSE